jgi:hypothetical protein
MIHPGAYLQRVARHGELGVFTAVPIPRGTVVWVRDALDQVLTPERVAALPELLKAQVARYAYTDNRGDRVLCWDHTRFMNHACEPSLTSVGTLMEVANRDLAPGDELTCEYGAAFVPERFECACGSPRCRGGIVVDDLPALWDRWDRESAEALALAMTVEQPLLSAVRSDDPGAWIVQAIAERRPVTLPSWALGAPGGA